MVTKTILLQRAAVPTARTMIGELTCPEGFSRRIVEVRDYYSAAGTTYTKRDVEDLDEWHYNVQQVSRLPHYVDVVIGPRNRYIVFAAADAGTINVMYEIKFEETKA